MAMHRTKIPFGWYPDGYTREALKAGDERDFGDATAGLRAAGMIEPVGDTPKKDLAPVVAPVDASADDAPPAENPETDEIQPVEAPARRPGRPRKN